MRSIFFVINHYQKTFDHLITEKNWFPLLKRESVHLIAHKLVHFLPKISVHLIILPREFGTFDYRRKSYTWLPREIGTPCYQEIGTLDYQRKRYIWLPMKPVHLITKENGTLHYQRKRYTWLPGEFGTLDYQRKRYTWLPMKTVHLITKENGTLHYQVVTWQFLSNFSTNCNLVFGTKVYRFRWSVHFSTSHPR